jgi:2-polyprenyl-3-methyl-5-hydroxy-6-metoxy-1,4-benzoquinol methylase
MDSDSDHYNETIQTWNKLALLYQDKFMNLDLYNKTYDFYCDQFKQLHPEILEVGCGPGNITRYLLSKRPDFKILATDVAPAMIEVAAINNPDAEFKIVDARDITSLNAQFNGIVCGFCIPYLSYSDCEKFIHDCSKMLLPHGVLYLSFVEGDELNSGFISGSSGDRTYFYYHSLSKIELNLKSAEFINFVKFEIIYPLDDGKQQIHTVLIANK